jgi:predicted anti-sigma-YlaC factor YlaD
MNCDDIRLELELYAHGELDDGTAAQIAEHLRDCGECSLRYAQMGRLAERLKGLPDVYQPILDFKEGIMQVNQPEARRERRQASGFWRSRGWAVAAAVLALCLIGAVVVASVPALARQLPLPVGNRLGDLEATSKQAQLQNRQMQGQMDKLKIEIKDIRSKLVSVIQTSTNPLSADVNYAVQSVVMQFVEAQYAGDLKKMKSLSTPAMQALIDARPQDYLRDTSGKVTFAQMTDVSKNGDTYLEFVRLTDTKTFNESQYQEDFELLKVGDKYLVNSEGMDA